ncbi:MAG: M23 family metallopeptidase [Elusimicrobiota bacterium]
MFSKIKSWYKKKLTLIIAPNRGSRSTHITMSYPFMAFLLILMLFIFAAGSYFSNVYISYIQAMTANRKLVKEKTMYSKKVEEVLDMVNNLRKVETRLRGMLGMKTPRNLIENYPVGGSYTGDDSDLYFDFNTANSNNRFNANIVEVKRQTWEQNQSIKNIEGFIARKRDVLLSTPSIWPIFGYVTSGFGWRTHPITKRKEYHRAIDMYNPMGSNTPIRATARGRVVVSGWAGSLGKIIIIDHGNGFSTRYAHCSNLTVEQGDNVEQGQTIAYVGKTGLSTGPHIHYEVWYRGKPINPMRFVKGR